MGFAISYQSTERISPSLQSNIIDAARSLADGRTWLSCEPPFLSESEGTLAGASKPNFSPHAEDVASAKAEGLPDGTLNDLIDVLCELSRRYDVVWEIRHDFSDGTLGFIRNGECDDDVRVQCEAFSELAEDMLGEGLDLDDV